MKTYRQLLIIWLAVSTAAIAVAVLGFSLAGAGVAALYATAFGATALICLLGMLRRAPA
jgi:hypothetical protein